MWEQLLPSLIDGFRVITPDSRGHGRSTNPSGELSYAQLADDVAALIAALGLVRPVVGGYSDGGQVALELGARHPDAAGALIVGAAYPEFAATGIRAVNKAFLGADDTGIPNLAQLDINLGDFADLMKARHPGGDEQWRTLVGQSASMWLDYRRAHAGRCPRDRSADPGVHGRPRRDVSPRSDGVALPDAAERGARRLSARRSLRARD